MVALVIWVMRPSWVDYQALSLGSVTWRRHRRWVGAIALAFTLLFRTITPAGDDTALIYPVLVAVSLLTAVRCRVGPGGHARSGPWDTSSPVTRSTRSSAPRSSPCGRACG